jgi:hypothetical protein
MGESSSDSGGSNNVARSNPNEMRSREMAAATNRAKEQQEAKSRQTAFNDYQQQRSAASKGIDVMISPKQASTVRENAGLAMDLDSKAKKSQINVPVPTIGTVAMNTISSINYKNQADVLRSGGRPVYDAKDASYQGVVGTSKSGVSTYSGNPDFSPIGRSDGVTRTSSGSYQTTQMDSGSSDNSPPTETVVSPSPTDVTTRTPTPTLSTASRRALIAGSGGGAARRNLL